MDLLLGSNSAEADRQDFFRTQVLFWMLCAIDGHAKNFSVSIEAGGSYRLTPRYDVLSAYPVLGHGANLLSPNKVRMAMAWLGKNRHYRWHEITRRQMEDKARRCGIGETVQGILSGLITATPRVTRAVSKLLPQNFPAHVSEPILKGLHEAADRLAREGAL